MKIFSYLTTPLLFFIYVSSIQAYIGEDFDKSVNAEPVLIPAQAQVYYYRGIPCEVYPSYVIVSKGYDRPSVQNMVTLSNQVKWDTFYVKTPEGLREYSTQYIIKQDSESEKCSGPKENKRECDTPYEYTPSISCTFSCHSCHVR